MISFDQIMFQSEKEDILTLILDFAQSKNAKMALLLDFVHKKCLHSVITEWRLDSKIIFIIFEFLTFQQQIVQF